MTWEEILSAVEKPSRYVGGELNAVRKAETGHRLSFALAFPDTYEVGMSHLGLQILYAILNDIPGVAAERCFAPWPDLERLLRLKGVPLCSLESQTPLSRFDLVGFSLQYELSFTNVLNMLDLGGIPLRGADRREGHPIIIAGGPCAFNPRPLAAFVDAFVVGEGEEVIAEIAETAMAQKALGKGRDHILAALAELEGLYVPSRHTEGTAISKRIIRDLNAWRQPSRPLVPLMKAIHDRVTLEVARGCTRGCRFCQAGMVWRPVRERRQDVLEGMAHEMLCATGHDELSLLSLSSGDYSRIEPLLLNLMDRYYPQRIAMALPSLRAETLSQGLIEGIRRVRKTSFTLAPEAGTQRLRDMINKGNTEAELLDTVGRVFEAGWRSLKLYFMIGLPGEMEEDLAGIVDLSHRALKEGKKRGDVTVNLSTFVPKPHTPYQWQRQLGLQETLEKQAFFRRELRHRHIHIKWHDARMSLLEGLFSRGDAAMGELLERAYLLGCRFDGWSDRFRFDLWDEAIRQANLDVDPYLCERAPLAALPWEDIDCGIERSFLMGESEKSASGILTPDCRTGPCHNCGVCDHREIFHVIAAEGDTAGETPRVLSPPASGSAGTGEPDGEAGRGRPVRVCFSKRGTARFLSHLELSQALIRAMRQAEVAFVYSQGYHPHPRISFAFATAVGMESLEEYAEIQIQNPGGDMEAMRDRINRLLPAGVEILTLEEILPGGFSLSERICAFTYQAALPEGLSPAAWEQMALRIEGFFRSGSFILVRTIKDKTVVRDIFPLVESLEAREEDRKMLMSLRVEGQATVRPIDVLTEILGIDPDVARAACITKTSTRFR